MSETEHHKGKLIPVSGELQAASKLELGKMGLEVDKDYNNNFDQLMDMTNYDGFLKIDKTLYRIDDEGFEPDDEILMASKNEDGSFDYEVRYHNGGCGFGEAI